MPLFTAIIYKTLFYSSAAVSLLVISKKVSNNVWVRAKLKPLTADEQFALDGFFYYRNLDSKNKKRFQQRVIHFLRTKQFIGQQMELTSAMKVWIAATAVKISFGLSPILYLHFKKIYIYPNAYHSPDAGNLHLGEVNPHSGVIRLSWLHFLAGYADFEDGKNLGIHEMAHALKFENVIKNGNQNFFPTSLLEQWNQLVDLHFAIRSQQQLSETNIETALIRPYAYTNKFEFFSVCLELFFEKPIDLNQNHPEIYQTLCNLLRQDPINKVWRIIEPKP